MDGSVRKTDERIEWIGGYKSNEVS